MTISQQKNISEKNGTEYIQWDLLLNQSTIHPNSTNSSMETEYNWAILLWSPLIIFGIAGNILVCMAISMEKRLQTVTNYFLLSLAVTDLLVCVIVMPLSIINEFTGKKNTFKHKLLLMIIYLFLIFYFFIMIIHFGIYETLCLAEKKTKLLKENLSTFSKGNNYNNMFHFNFSSK